MFAILLAAIGSLFGEVSSSIGKWEVRKGKESVYTMGFLDGIFSFLLFALIAIFHQTFFIPLSAWPVFIPLIVSSVLQGYLAVHAISRADRSTYSFIRTGTIPLVLMIDISLGYRLSWFAIFGILLIFFSLFFLYQHRDMNRRGVWWVVGCAFNAAIAISLFKRMISVYQAPVESVQMVLLGIELIGFYLIARFRYKENPFRLLRRRPFFVQSLSQGIANIFNSFAYVFAPASILVAAERSFSVIWSVLFGKMYFHESRFRFKAIALALIVCGIVLLRPV